MNNSNGGLLFTAGLYQINMNVVNSTTNLRALVYLQMSNPLKNYKGNANPDMSFLEVNNGSVPLQLCGSGHLILTIFKLEKDFIFTNGMEQVVGLMICGLLLPHYKTKFHRQLPQDLV